MNEQQETAPAEIAKPRTYADLRKLLFDNTQDKMSLNEALMLVMLKIEEIENMVKK